MRRWLIKLLANGNPVMANLDMLGAGVDLSIPRGKELICINSQLNGANLIRVERKINKNNEHAVGWFKPNERIN